MIHRAPAGGVQELPFVAAFAQAQAGDAKIIWVDSDGYLQASNADTKQLILTSVMKLIGNAVFDTISAAVEPWPQATSASRWSSRWSARR